jgi:hypothetical protein
VADEPIVRLVRAEHVADDLSEAEGFEWADVDESGVAKDRQVVADRVVAPL